jgi:N-hydroxyarylamine O-acetyltransferase
MDLAAYFNRINYHGSLEPTLETLTALHRAHLMNIAYENFDIHLDRPLSMDEPAIFNKLVHGQRGGWCYEMNGLFAAVLRELGFKVTLLSSAVDRPHEGDLAENSHLILRVDLDRPYLVDVGFGNGILDPIPLEPGQYTQGYLTYGLDREGDRWYFRNQPNGGPGFDFTLQPKELTDFVEKSTWFQYEPDSRFRKIAFCFRFRPGAVYGLIGVVLRETTEKGTTETHLKTEADYRRALEDIFGIYLRGDDLSALWAKVWREHLAWVARSQAAS